MEFRDLSLQCTKVAKCKKRRQVTERALNMLEFEHLAAEAESKTQGQGQKQRKNPRPRTALPRGQGQECSRPRPKTKNTGINVLQKKDVQNFFQAFSKQKI